MTINGTHVFWSNFGLSTIASGESRRHGREPVVHHRRSFPIGVTVSGTHVFWPNAVSNTIGRANLDGTGVNQSFITGASAPYGVVASNSSSVLPVELAAFTATASGRTAHLSWTTASETNNVGFTVEHQTGDAQAGAWTDASGLIAGRGTTTERHDYAFTATGLTAGRHTFRLRRADTDGTVHHSAPVKVEIGVETGLRLTVLEGRGVRVETEGEALVTVVDVLGRVAQSTRVAARARPRCASARRCARACTWCASRARATAWPPCASSCAESTGAAWCGGVGYERAVVSCNGSSFAP